MSFVGKKFNFNIFYLSKDETERNEEQTPFRKRHTLKDFPDAVIKDWSNINIKKEIGEGNFGKVFKGYVHLNEVQR